MHDDIKKFSLTGVMGENNVVLEKENLVRHLEDNMRDFGFIPALDLEPQFTLDYDREKETFNFELSVYGIQVGKEDAWQGAGMMGGKMIMKSTPPVKSRES